MKKIQFNRLQDDSGLMIEVLADNCTGLQSLSIQNSQ